MDISCENETMELQLRREGCVEIPFRVFYGMFETNTHLKGPLSITINAHFNGASTRIILCLTNDAAKKVKHEIETYKNKENLLMHFKTTLQSSDEDLSISTILNKDAYYDQTFQIPSGKTLDLSQARVFVLAKSTDGPKNGTLKIEISRCITISKKHRIEQSKTNDEEVQQTQTKQAGRGRGGALIGSGRGKKKKRY